MQKRRSVVLSILFIAFSLLAACTAAESETTDAFPTAESPTSIPQTAEPAPTIPTADRQTMEVILDYALLTRSQMIDSADAIFVGRVTDISPTTWNQDNGQYWEQEIEGTTMNAMPVHQLAVAVLEPIKDEIGLGETAVLTINGKSPADDGPVPISDSLELGGTADYDLKVGDQLVLFVEQREFAWWNPDEQMEYNAEQGAFVGARRPVLTFANLPTASYLLLGADGLYHPQPPAEELEAGPLSLEALVEEVDSQDSNADNAD